jgi:hypothetical protein
MFDHSLIAVLGTYRGGTSEVSEILRNLGCFAGDSFFNAGSGYCTYEDVSLRDICLQCFDEREHAW